MTERSAYQQKVIKRYYDRQDEILLGRLQELVGALYLSETERKTEQLWTRVEKALVGLKVPESIRTHLLTGRNVEALARNLRGWLEEAKKR